MGDLTKGTSVLRRHGSGRNRKWDRSLWITLATGLVLLLVLGLIFSVAFGSRQITTSAGSLHNADEALQSTIVVRAQLALAAHMVAVEEITDAYLVPQIDNSVGEARDHLDYLEEAMAHLDDNGLVHPEALSALARFRNSAEAMLALVESHAPAVQQADVPIVEDYAALVTQLDGIRNGLSEKVKASDRVLGHIGNLARFLVAFFIPAAVILIYRELIRRQQRQAELETRLDAERQINSSREQFIANASHELRTPLTSIMGLSMMLAENPAVSEDAAAYELVSIIVGESEDLARMVEDLLTVARLDAGALHYSFEDISVREELVEIAEGAERSGMSVTTSIDGAVIRADRLRFRQILRNLLSNAKKYGGPNVRLEGVVDGRTYAVSIIDDGKGIPEHLHERLFERFIHQASSAVSKDSVGLGLSIVHSLTLDMGGSITYDYSGGESHFVVRLPLTDSNLPSGESIEAAGRATAGEGLDTTSAVV